MAGLIRSNAPWTRGPCAVLVLLLSAATAAQDGAPSQPAPATNGTVWADITDILGRPLKTKVVLTPAQGGQPIEFRSSKGTGQWPCPAGAYSAHTHIYDEGIPILIDIRDLVVREGQTTDLLVELVEGAAPGSSPHDFDTDADLVMDRVELAAGTDPKDAASFPGCRPIEFASPVLSAEAGWYRGELHARSSYGGGEESVAKLVRRAEKAGLDFLAITDRNTMQACQDPGFHSDRVVLIPAMEWGSDERGVALIYGPGTFPEPVADNADAQGLCQLVQAQQGVFAIAHPCFGFAPWQWGPGYPNAIEVWCRGWRSIPPISLDQFDDEYGRRHEGRLVYSIAQAVSTPDLSGNGQAALFWDYELVRGVMASPIAGSLSSSPSVPLGQPITYVYALEKSARGIVDGLRSGRTFVSSGPDGPIIRFTADVLHDGKTDVGMGGIVPTGVDTQFQIQIGNANGMKAVLLYNGRSILSKKIEQESDDQFFVLRHTQHPVSYAVFRVCVVRTATEPGFGPLDVVAMSSPIYAQEMLVVDGQTPPEELWIKLENDAVPPAQVTGMMEDGGKTWVRTGAPPAGPEDDEAFTPPPGAEVRTLVPSEL
ncbi:MAG: CehA/McbA family metallohydrolase [Candidatus Hydrogenedentes bacterium]|nr:CehA/McbA family metallohydrolase [Candidatus Hydrogenedentota bacterium]